MNGGRLRLLVLLVCTGWTVPGGNGCRKAQTEPEPTAAPRPVEIAPEKPVEVPTRVDLPVPLEDANRWLFVQKVEGKARGGWATGSFDAGRNKLIVSTSDIEEFALDTSKVKINWQKLVVLSINGKNSELRKRDYDILHFTRTPHGEWVVKEP